MEKQIEEKRVEPNSSLGKSGARLFCLSRLPFAIPRVNALSLTAASQWYRLATGARIWFAMRRR